MATSRCADEWTEFERAQFYRARCEEQGRFWVRMVTLYEEMAAKWEEFSGEQFEREVEATKAADCVAACRAEWSRWNRRVKDLAPHGSEREAA